jgi:nicotinate-nucleotide pyrophosphorylase (carboxylating)
MNVIKARKLIEDFLIEDAEHGDITANAIFNSEQQCKAKIVAKQNGYISGMDLLQLGYEVVDNRLSVETFLKDGQEVSKGDCIAEIRGPVKAILLGERVVLNLLQRLSGITSMTCEAVKKLNDNSIRICDTRKTTPGLRMFEKYAVTCGGGFNHRFGLSDAVLIKENHITAAGGIKEAVKAVRSNMGSWLMFKLR